MEGSPVVAQTPTREEFYLGLGLWASQRSTCLRARVGCVVAKESGVIAVSYNGAPKGAPHCLDIGCILVEGHCITATHAEINAIAHCAKLGISTFGANLFVTHSPCTTCAKAIVRAGIGSVSFLHRRGDADISIPMLVNADLVVQQVDFEHILAIMMERFECIIQ